MVEERHIEKCVICGEEFEPETEDHEYLDNGVWDEFGYLPLDEELIGGYVCIYCIENLDYYGNRLIYYGHEGKLIVDFNERIYGYAMQDYEDFDKLADILLELEEIMKLYRWKASDGWRGHYEPRKNSVGRWVRVIEGWNDAFSGNEYTERVKEAMETFRPLVVVYPRSSNLCVVYYDLWTEKGLEKELSSLLLPEKEAFSWSRGIYIKALT